MKKIIPLSSAVLRRLKPQKRIHGALFSLSIGPSEQLSAACVVSKKVSSKAVVRNRVKRRARAAYAKLLRPLREGAYLFYAKASAAEAPYREIEADMSALLSRVR